MSAAILRLDDVGAASKQYEQYAKITLGKQTIIAPAYSPFNWGGVKRWPAFRGWGVYEELTAGQWTDLLALLQRRQARMTVGVTAAWVEENGDLTPFPQKFPAQAAVLREGMQAGLVEIAHHGLTHCVLGGRAYLPHPLRSNRLYHREFWSWVPPQVHREHIFRAQEILTDTFRTNIVTFIPPGTVWTPITEKCAAAAGLKYLSAREGVAPTGHTRHGLRCVGTAVVHAFHDRELVLAGKEWLQRLLDSHRGDSYYTVAEYGARLASGDDLVA